MAVPGVQPRLSSRALKQVLNTQYSTIFKGLNRVVVLWNRLIKTIYLQWTSLIKHCFTTAHMRNSEAVSSHHVMTNPSMINYCTMTKTPLLPITFLCSYTSKMAALLLVEWWFCGLVSCVSHRPLHFNNAVIEWHFGHFVFQLKWQQRAENKKAVREYMDT